MDSIEIKTMLMKANRSQKYLSKVFRKPESHISLAISGKQYPALREKIINHLNKILIKPKE